MTDPQFDAANANKANRAIITNTLGLLPALDEGAALTARDFSSLMNTIAPFIEPETDARIPDTVSTALVDCYNALRSALTDLNETLTTEYGAI